MLHDTSQWLLSWKAGRIDVANPVAWDDDPPFVLRMQLNAAVIDLELLVGVQIVPNDHLVGAPERDATSLDRRDPAQIQVGNDSGCVVQSDIDDIRTF